MAYPENSVSAARVAKHEERQRIREEWKKENQRRAENLLNPVSFHRYLADRSELEHVALAAAEDYSKEGSLSEQDVSHWAADFARRYQTGETA